jgi:hypothetical protein
MSTEVHVFFGGKLPDKRTLSRAMAELGFPFTIAAGSLERQSGFMPMRLRREATGVEFYVCDSRADIEEIAGADLDPTFQRIASFRWGGDEDEMLAGMCAAAALSRLVNGVVFAEAEDTLLSPGETIALTRQTLQATLKPADPLRPGTRPADLKRYLKPLLTQRSDLVLVGRMLIVRPVRHLLRGAFLDRTSDKYNLRLWPYLTSLWGPQQLGHLHDLHGHLWHTWQPHFSSLLIDVLQQDIFAPFGEITSLGDLATALSNTDYFPSLPIALLLAGERDRAEQYIRDIENENPGSHYRQQWATDMRELLSHDIQEICSRHHAKEAETIKALKLESIWEPSPFPVEVPAAERRSRTSEPHFKTEPWPSRPQGLLRDPPQESGDVFFARDRLFRGGRDAVLIAALTRQEAADRHDNGEGYVLATRVRNKILLLLRFKGRDRLDPSHADHSHPPLYAGEFLAELHGADCFAQAVSFRDYDTEDSVEVAWVDVTDRETKRVVWACHLYKEERKLGIWDHRAGDSARKQDLTQAELQQFSCTRPAFGDFNSVVRLLLDVLELYGFGTLV